MLDGIYASIVDINNSVNKCYMYVNGIAAKQRIFKKNVMLIGAFVALGVVNIDKRMRRQAAQIKKLENELEELKNQKGE